MTNRSKAVGTSWESACRDYLQAVGWPHTERLALSGGADRGDLTGIPAVMIECKAEKQITLAAYAAEVEAQKRNARADVGVAWIKRPRKGSPADGYVVMSGEQFVQLLKAAGY